MPDLWDALIIIAEYAQSNVGNAYGLTHTAYQGSTYTHCWAQMVSVNLGAGPTGFLYGFDWDGLILGTLLTVAIASIMHLFA